MEQQLDRNPRLPDALQNYNASDERDIKENFDIDETREMQEDYLDRNPILNHYTLNGTVEGKEDSFQEDAINNLKNNNNINTDNGVNDGSEEEEMICRIFVKIFSWI